LDYILKDVAADMHVDGRQRVVQDVDVRVGVRRARDGDALLLAAAQIDALLADLRAVAGWQGLRACASFCRARRALARARRTSPR
jgi:hypothetical protein